MGEGDDFVINYAYKGRQKRDGRSTERTVTGAIQRNETV